MAMVAVAILESFTNTGTDLALLRNTEATREHYDTAWTLEIIQAVLLAAVLFASAPLVGGHFEDARVTEVVRMLSLRALIGGFQNVGVVQFRRDLHFGREFRFGVAKKLATFTVTVAAAFLLHSYWALVIGQIAGRVIEVGISYSMSDYRPRITLSRLGEIWGFSQWLVLARFSRLVRAYLERHPSRHWSLNPLGHAFARFLEREAPRGPRIGLLVELARLEWSLQEVFEAPPSPTLAEGALARIAPGDWSKRRLVPIAALQLFAFEHRCNAIAGSVRRDEPLPPLGRQRTFVAVYRKDWKVWRMDLDRLQFELLAALCRGRTLAQALEHAARGHRGSQAELAKRVQGACASFVSEGFFGAVR